MRKLISVVITAFVGFTLFDSNADQTRRTNGISQRPNTLMAFVGADLIIEPGNRQRGKALIVEHGVIKAIQDEQSIPAAAQRIDLSGMTIYPGFIDPFSDYSFSSQNSTRRGRNNPPQYDADRSGGQAANDANHAHINWVDQFKPSEKAAESFINNGFTVVQSARLDGIFRGQAVTVSLADSNTPDVILNANSQHFGSFNKGSSKQAYPSSLMGSIALIRQSLSDANWYQRAQGKLDIWTSGQPVEYNAGLDALNELTNAGLLFDANSSQSTLRAAQLFKPFKLPVSFVAEGDEYAHIKAIKATEATFVVPINFPTAPDVDRVQDQLDITLAELRHYERAPSNPAEMANANIEFAFTQHGLKKSSQFWPNLRLAIEHGLSEQDALRALTITPAKLTGTSSIAGRLQPNMRASFVVVKGNIFSDGEIKSVWLDGQPKHLSPILEYDFSGQYKLNLDGQLWQLSLQQKNNKVAGKLEINDQTFSIKVNHQYQNQLAFSVVISDIEQAGAYMFETTLNKGVLSGNLVRPNGSSNALNISATKDSSKTAAASEEKAKKASAYVSRATYPNRSFVSMMPPISESIHIKNATLWTSENEGILQQADLLVRNGKIQRIGKQLKTPNGYRIIDATNKHVTAGIIDEHSHVAISNGVNEGSEAVTSEVRIADVVNPTDINIYRAMAGGTTTAQLLHGSANPIGGQAQVIKLRWGADAESLKFKQAPASIKFALGENVKQSNWGDNYRSRYPQSRMGVETIIRDAFHRAREYKASWEEYDDLSRHEKRKIAPPRRDYRMEALVEILDKQRFVHSHSYVASEIIGLMRVAEDFDFRIQTFTHILEGYKVADQMAAHGASASTFADWWAYKFEVLDAIPQNTCLMMQRGVNVSVNSDSGDLIRRLNTEAAKSINYCDMSQEDAWKMVTINPAKQLKIDQYTGSLKKGKDADFVIWSGNPLSIYSKVEQTWIDGKNYFNREVDAQMRTELATERNLLIQKILGVDSPLNANQTADIDHAFYEQQEPTWHCEDNFDFWLWKNQRLGEANLHTHTGAH